MSSYYTWTESERFMHNLSAADNIRRALKRQAQPDDQEDSMHPSPIPSEFRASPARRMLFQGLILCAIAGGAANLFAQVIDAPSLTPFDARAVGTTSGAKSVRIGLRHPLALTSVGIAPGYTEFSAGAVSGCVINGTTVNPSDTACTVPVTFTPKYPGLRTAPLIVTDSSGNKYSVGLVGTGLAPNAALTPGIVTKVAGGGNYGNFGGDGGPATSADIYSPRGVVVDPVGNYYIADLGNRRVRKVDTSGNITTVAGTGAWSFSDWNSWNEGPATNAEITPQAIALDTAGNLYIADVTVIRKVDLNGIITTIAGNGTPGYAGDGMPATDAEFEQPQGLAVDTAGNVYIADTGNCLIRKIDTSGIINKVAGKTSTTVSGEVVCGRSGDGGLATNAELDGPMGIALDAKGNLYFADIGNYEVRKVNTSGIITTVAGNAQAGFTGDGGPAVSAELNLPIGVAVDAAGNLYIADAYSGTPPVGNQRVRRVDVNGIIKTVAGDGAESSFSNGVPATSTSVNPYGIALDPAGNLYVADNWNNLILKINLSESAYTFQTHVVNTTSPAIKFVLTDNGNQHLSISGLDMTGDYHLLSGETSDCPSSGILGTGDSCALRIDFEPLTAGTLTGAATITDNANNHSGATQQVPLSGTGANP